MGENWIERSLIRLDPDHHQFRATVAYWHTNPGPYFDNNFRKKVHINQNEKLVIFEITHIVAIDRYNDNIVAAVVMPIKNWLSMYEHVYV